MEPIEHVIEPVSAPARRVAAGGWRRGAVGIALGVVAGALVAAVTPPDRTRGHAQGSAGRDRSGSAARDRRRGSGWDARRGSRGSAPSGPVG